MMRECYAEVEKRWGPKATAGNRLAHGSMDEAFFSEPHIGVAIPEVVDGDRLDFSKEGGRVELPSAARQRVARRDLDEGAKSLTLTNYIPSCFELDQALMQSTIGLPGQPSAGQSAA